MRLDPDTLAGFLPTDVEDLRWHEDALCAQMPGLADEWFPDKGGPTVAAKRVCAACPVITECLDYALANNERFGVWGGKSERERRAIADTPASRASGGIAKGERTREAVARLTAEGMTAPEIAEQLHTTKRTVERARAINRRNPAA